jgi:hypothetical protein
VEERSPLSEVQVRFHQTNCSIGREAIAYSNQAGDVPGRSASGALHGKARNTRYLVFAVTREVTRAENERICIYIQVCAARDEATDSYFHRIKRSNESSVVVLDYLRESANAGISVAGMTAVVGRSTAT